MSLMLEICLSILALAAAYLCVRVAEGDATLVLIDQSQHHAGPGPSEPEEAWRESLD